MELDGHPSADAVPADHQVQVLIHAPIELKYRTRHDLENLAQRNAAAGHLHADGHPQIQKASPAGWQLMRCRGCGWLGSGILIGGLIRIRSGNGRTFRESADIIRKRVHRPLGILQDGVDLILRNQVIASGDAGEGRSRRSCRWSQQNRARRKILWFLSTPYRSDLK